MKLTKKIILVGAAVLIAGTVSAQTSVPNTFTANTTASATEVNANFTALVSAVNALSARVDALEADPSFTLNDLVGRTYCVIFVGSITGVDTNFARISNYYGASKFAITSTAQATLTTSLDKEHELGFGVGGAGPVLESSITNYDHAGAPENITITGLSNGVLNTDIGPFDFSSDGSTFIGVDFTSEDASESEGSFIVGMRCD